MDGVAGRLRALVGTALAVVIGVGAAGVHAQEGPGRWRVHEWGTFTALQDEAGRSIGGVNTEDEPLPRFVHRVAGALVPADELAPAFFQGAPAFHPDVTLRLETPVLYFHPPAGATLPVKVDVEVAFRGGWLTEFYPHAAVAASGRPEGRFTFGRLTGATVGRLAWKDVSVGEERPVPDTTAAVWLAPRRVAAAPVALPNGEAERYLFYRGVGHVDAPLAVSRTADGKALEIRSRLPRDLEPVAPLTVAAAWLTDIRPDGSAAFRTLPPFRVLADPQTLVASAPAAFAGSEYAAGRVDALRDEMRNALVGAGLHVDEAQALLDTWQVSYFKSPGTRLFFLLPRAWTDRTLPLSVSLGADVTRVMVGRIELITPTERALLARIASGPSSSPAWYYQWIERNREAFSRYLARRAEGNLTSLRAENIAIPADYTAYLELGRFRHALVLDELQRRPTRVLREFVRSYGLDGSRTSGR